MADFLDLIFRVIQLQQPVKQLIQVPAAVYAVRQTAVGAVEIRAYSDMIFTAQRRKMLDMPHGVVNRGAPCAVEEHRVQIYSDAAAAAYDNFKHIVRKVADVIAYRA